MLNYMDSWIQKYCEHSVLASTLSGHSVRNRHKEEPSWQLNTWRGAAPMTLLRNRHMRTDGFSCSHVHGMASHVQPICSWGESPGPPLKLPVPEEGHQDCSLMFPVPILRRVAEATTLQTFTKHHMSLSWRFTAKQRWLTMISHLVFLKTTTSRQLNQDTHTQYSSFFATQCHTSVCLSNSYSNRFQSNPRAWHVKCWRPTHTTVTKPMSCSHQILLTTMKMTSLRSF